MKSYSIAVGDRFGAWVVTSESQRKKFGEGRNANYVLLYPCRCDCGTERLVRAFKLLSNSRSCGCLTAAIKSDNSTRHGHNRPGSRSRIYTVWDGMNQRCGNPHSTNYARYGGRGISVCQEWRSFSVFASLATSHGYEASKQLDRIDNDGNYEPENCRWVSDAENKRNTSQIRFITAFGESKCLTDWALDPRCSVAPQTILYRINRRQWLPEDAISQPRQSRKRSPPFIGNHPKKHRA